MSKSERVGEEILGADRAMVKRVRERLNRVGIGHDVQPSLWSDDVIMATLFVAASDERVLDAVCNATIAIEEG